MKARRILLVILLIVGIVVAGLTGASCAEKQKTVSKIEIIDGSFEEVYAVDQKIDFAKAKILVTYTDRTTATIPVTQEMVSGFDTSVAGRTGTITVTYQGKTATFAYRVQASGTSDTPFRLSMRATGKTLNVSAGSVAAAGNLYVIRFSVVVAEGVSVASVVNARPDWEMRCHTQGTVTTILLYSPEGDTPLAEDGDLVRLALEGAGGTTVRIQSASVTDGTRDLAVPASSVQFPA